MYSSVNVAIYNQTCTNLSDVFEASNYRPPVKPLDKSEAPVRRKLGVPNYQERESDISVVVHHGVPQQVLDHGAVLIVPSTVSFVWNPGTLPGSILGSIIQQKGDHNLLSLV